MDVELIFKIAAVGIIVAVLCQLLIRSGREEQAMLTSLAGLIVVLTLIVSQISGLSFDGEFRLPLVLALASPIFHSSCEGKLGIALE